MQRNLQGNCRALVLACLSIACLAGGRQAEAVLLYDVDFDEAPHVPGQTVAVGTGSAPRNTPSEINFGAPQVQNSLGSLYRPLVLNHRTADSGNYSQVQFGLSADNGGFSTQYPYYRTEMDVLVQSLPSGSEFRVFFDGTNANQIDMLPSNDMYAWVLNQANGYKTKIGTFRLGQVYHLKVDTDFVKRSWTIAVDGNTLFTGPYTSEPFFHMHAVRVHLTAASTALVGVDNVKIYGLPEPVTALPCLLVTMLLRRRGTRR